MILEKIRKLLEVFLEMWLQTYSFCFLVVISEFLFIKWSTGFEIGCELFIHKKLRETFDEENTNVLGVQLK